MLQPRASEDDVAVALLPDNLSTKAQCRAIGLGLSLKSHRVVRGLGRNCNFDPCRASPRTLSIYPSHLLLSTSPKALEFIKLAIHCCFHLQSYCIKSALEQVTLVFVQSRSLYILLDGNNGDGGAPWFTKGCCR
jgi:hypothetical protein